MDLQRLVELNGEGRTDAEIASILNVSRQLVQLNRKKLGLKSPFKYSSFRKMDYEEVEKLVKENKTDREIAELYNVKPVSVYFFRKRNNIERDNLLVNKAIEPTDRQLSIIVGSLLGDASLRKSNINPIFNCEHGIKQLEYCKWKAKELESLGSKFSTSKRKTVDPRTSIYYESAICRLPANPALLKLYSCLYVEGRKTITKEYLQYFNELSLAVMFMDDGYKLGKTIGIATNCFIVEELALLNDFFSEKFGIVFNITKSNTLYLPSAQYPAFEELVLPYMHKDLMYKLSVS
jgi:DNA-binding CsgD family transcriptional regulator